MEAIKKAAITLAIALAAHDLFTTGNALSFVLAVAVLNIVYGKAMYKAWYKQLTR